jgi:hypothetical protein
MVGCPTNSILRWLENRVQSGHEPKKEIFRIGLAGGSSLKEKPASRTARHANLHAKGQ